MKFEQPVEIHRNIDRTSSKWAKIAECSQDTALRDIDDLLGKGVLAKEPGGGCSTSYTLAEIAWWVANSERFERTRHHPV